MISSELVNLINSGELIAFVGSGVSADAGLPTWFNLFATLEIELRKLGHDTSKAITQADKDNFPKAFDLLASLTTRSDIHTRAATLIKQTTTPGRYHTMIADWPFRLYITTNYDHLIEKGSSGKLTPVGNRGNELYKLTGGINNIIWHIHGGVYLQDDVSQLVLTDADYLDFYPDSNVVTIIKSILSTSRCVFIGFGFNDKDLMRILESIGRLSNSGRPNYAFLDYNDKPKSEQYKHQKFMLDKFNIEVIPYFSRVNDHSDLFKILSGYQPFIVRRAISFGSSRNVPQYNPIASSLKIQSNLDLKELSSARTGVKEILIGARILAYIREHNKLLTDISSLFRSEEIAEHEILTCVERLRKRGLISGSPDIKLTDKYRQKENKERAHVELAKDKFLNSVRNRIKEINETIDETSTTRTANIASSFLDELCKQRGLGVAQNLATSDDDQATLRSVSLIQTLPNSLRSCESREEALIIVSIIKEILTRPTQEEAAFLGLLCQAYFGQHLVGADYRLAKIDMDMISGTCYILDASVLVCLLADGTEINKFTTNLINNLIRADAILTTTDLFIEEILEHANWAIRLVDKYGEQSGEILEALRCRGSYRPNQFLRGRFLGDVKDQSFSRYISRVFSTETHARLTDDIVANRLKYFNIHSLKFSEWIGFDQALFHKRDEIQQEIFTRRTGQGTYKHSRQIQAEAEVALIVDGIRNKQLKPHDNTAKDAFFLSSTRVVDRLRTLERRICLRPEGLAQWLSNSQDTTQQHTELVFEQLLWELSQGDIEFVDKSTLLRKFSGVIEAADAELKVCFRDRHDFLVEKYGPDPEKAFMNADPLDFPRILTEIQNEALKQMEQEVAAARQDVQRARIEAKISDNERNELAKLRAHAKERKRQGKRKLRASQSKKGKKRGRAKRK
jgi:hypothetical protein